MAISRQKEARSRDYSLPELSNESVLYGAQGHRKEMNRALGHLCAHIG